VQNLVGIVAVFSVLLVNILRIRLENAFSHPFLGLFRGKNEEMETFKFFPFRNAVAWN